jgi:PhnB protein
MRLNAYLFFDGNCREAFETYARVLGGEVTLAITFGTHAGGLGGPEWADRIYHATVEFAGIELLGADCPPDGFRPMQGFTITLAPDDPAEARRIFDALAEGGSVKLPLQQTFWSAAFGELTDRFGVPWMINCAS